MYQGKEEQEELDTYDFHARMYDQWLGRTWQIDPMASKYYGFSPYSWVANNPLIFTDPTGMVIDWSALRGKEHREERREIKQALGDIKKSGETGKQMVKYLNSKESGRITVSSRAESVGILGSFAENLNIGGEGWGGVPGFKQDEIGGNLNLDLDKIALFREKTADVAVEEVAHAVLNSAEARAVGNNGDESSFLTGNREFAAKAIVGQVEKEQGSPIQMYSGDQTARFWGINAFAKKSTEGFMKAAQQWRSESGSYTGVKINANVPVGISRLFNRKL